jgi:hypothetical protein
MIAGTIPSRERPMALLDWFTRPPSREKFTQQVMAGMRAALR